MNNDILDIIISFVPTIKEDTINYRKFPRTEETIELLTQIYSDIITKTKFDGMIIYRHYRTYKFSFDGRGEILRCIRPYYDKLYKISFEKNYHQFEWAVILIMYKNLIKDNILIVDREKYKDTLWGDL